MKKLSSLFLLLILASCGQKVRFSGITHGSSSNIEPIVVVNTTLEFGEKKEVSLFSSSCSSENELPKFVTLDPSTCKTTITGIHAGDFGPFEFKSGASLKHLNIKVNELDEPSLPPVTVPLPVATYYTLKTLPTDENLIVTFGVLSGKNYMFFIDATNPLKPSLIAQLQSATFFQDITFIGSTVFVVGSNGEILAYDWSNKNSPTLVKSVKIGSGQHFDVTSDGESKLFIANTAQNKVYIVDVSNVSNPTLVQTLDSVSVAAGVTYLDGYLYATAYGTGKIVTYKKEASGSFAKVSETQSGLVNAITRPLASNGKLFVPKYGGNQVEVYSLDDKENPARIETITLSGVHSIYAKPIVQFGELILTSGTSIAKYKVYKDNSPLTFISETAVDCEAEGCAGIVGLGAFRNGSMLGFIGSKASSPNQRLVRTMRLP